MNLANLSRTFRTVRYLRLSQVGARLHRILARRGTIAIAPENLGRLVDHGLGAAVEAMPEPEHTGARGTTCIELLERGLIRHLNHTQAVGRQPVDWRLGAVASDRLWAITLHYHEWLYELAKSIRDEERSASVARGLWPVYLGDWLATCDLGSPGAEVLACNSYAIATRLGWWVRTYFALPDQVKAAHAPLVDDWLAAAWRQAEHLFRHLEWDLRANHLLRDAVGLAWAGRFFGGERPQRWLARATEIAKVQAREQVLADGGHFERSPMYHLEVMNDFLTLAVLLRDGEAAEMMHDTWRRMAAYIAWLSHPDGETAQLNDGGRRSVADALQLGRQVGMKVDTEPPRGNRFFGESGVIVRQSQRWSIFFDVGNVGPDYQPGHAHADTLSIECSFHGKRLFVDPGCYGYDRDLRRKYDRSTAAHNTVCIDERDSSEVWDIFRVGQRARPVNVEARIADDLFVATAAHNGFDQLPGSPRHSRLVEVDRHGRLRLVDRVEGRQQHRVSGGFLLAPQWQVKPWRGGWRLSSDGESLDVRVTTAANVRLSVVSRPYHPDYGVECETSRLQWEYDGELPLSVIILVCPSQEAAA